MGGEDGAYKRNAIASEWKTKLAELHKADPEGYVHEVQIHEGKGHWMDKEDAVAVPWMAKFTRQPHPKKVVWLQDDVTHPRFYWMELPKESLKQGQRIVASIKDQTITIDEAKDVHLLTFLLTDGLLDLDKPIIVMHDGKQVLKESVTRTIRTLDQTLQDRPDPTQQYWARLSVILD